MVLLRLPAWLPIRGHPAPACGMSAFDGPSNNHTTKP